MFRVIRANSQHTIPLSPVPYAPPVPPQALANPFDWHERQMPGMQQPNAIQRAAPANITSLAVFAGVIGF